MSVEKQNTIRPLIESKNGLHLTIYIENPGHVLLLKRKIRNMVIEAERFLKPQYTEEQIASFLSPIKKLGKEGVILKRFKGNLALFRTPKSFRLLNLPIGVDDQCIVATTFHVKPLLRYLQTESDFLLLGLDKERATLYKSTFGHLRKIDSILFPEPLKMSFRKDGTRAKKLPPLSNKLALDTWDWINSWLKDLSEDRRLRLFVAGKKRVAEDLISRLEYQPKLNRPIANFFSEKRIFGVLERVRRHLGDESKLALQQAIVEYYWAEEHQRTQQNIFHIARAAVQGRIKKLIISDEVKIFGKMDPKTGGLSLHHTGLDHEDDDILDDLAQTVILKGGEVFLAKKNEIPYGRSALAILDSRFPRTRYESTFPLKDYEFQETEVVS